MWGAAAMALSSFTVCMNALRLNLFKVHSTKNDHPIRKRALPEENNLSEDNVTEVTENNLKKEKENDSMKKTIKIEGMMCEHCENHVREALEKLDGVDSAVVSHESGTAVVSVNDAFSAEQAEKAVTDAGYKFIGIE